MLGRHCSYLLAERQNLLDFETTFPLLTSQTEAEDSTMFMFGKSRTEALQVASQKKAMRAQQELDIKRKEKAEQKTRLRALRLAKEAADKKA